MQTDRQRDRRTDRWMNGRPFEGTDIRMNRWMDRWTDGRSKGWIDTRSYIDVMKHSNVWKPTRELSFACVPVLDRHQHGKSSSPMKDFV